MDIKRFKLEIFIPESHLKALQKTLQQVDAGHIGDYDSCLSYSVVTGTWRTLTGAHPYKGKENEITEEKEIKAEVVVTKEKLQATYDAICAMHPYEEPVIHVIPLWDISSNI